MIDINTAFLRNCRLFEDFTKEEFEDFCNTAELRAQCLEKKQHLVTQGDIIDCLAIVQSGTLLSEKIHSAWEPQLMDVYDALDVFLIEAYFSEIRTSPTCVIASTPAAIVWMPGFHRILYRPRHPKGQGLPMRHKLLKNLLGLMADMIIRNSYRFDVLSNHTIRGKLLAYLSNLTERRNSTTVNIGMSQESLARYLCVTRASLSVELRKMQKDGLIQYKGQSYTLLAPHENTAALR